MTKKDKEIVKKTTEELLSLLGVVATSSVSEKEGVINIELETEDAGIMIGRHGDMLESLQVVLSLCVAKKLGEFKRISVEIGEYKKNRTAYLLDLAQQTKQQVLELGEAVSLPLLKSWERRVVHLALAEDKEVISESEGEGRERVLSVKPR